MAFVLASFIVLVVEEIKGGLSVQWIEQGLVSDLNPIKDLREITRSNWLEFVERELCKEGIQIFEENREMLLQALIVEEYNWLGKGVMLKV